MKKEYITPIVKSIEMDRCMDPLCTSPGQDYSGESGSYDDDSD